MSKKPGAVQHRNRLLGPVAFTAYAVVLSAPVWIAWYWLVRQGNPGGRRAGCAAGQRARPEAGRLRSEPVTVRIQPGRFASASRMRISSTSASNPGASSPTMAAVRMAS